MSEPAPTPDAPGGGEPRGYEAARRRAEDLARDPERAADLVRRAASKADRLRGSRRAEGVWDDVTTLLRLARAWLRREYRAIPWRSLVAALAGLVYFLNPLDLVPDFLPFLGFLDDAAVLAFVIRSIAGDLERFRAWERGQRQQAAAAGGEGAAHERGD